MLNVIYFLGGREISKLGEKTAKKAGKSGRETRFFPEKKVKISPKYCFSGTLPFLGQKKTLILCRVVCVWVLEIMVKAENILREDIRLRIVRVGI